MRTPPRSGRLASVPARLKAGVLGPLMAGLVRGVFAMARGLGPDRSSDLGAFLARTIGPMLPQHRIALANLAAAFPDLDRRALRRIARGAWANLGRTGAEYAHLATLFDYDPDAPNTGRVEVEGIEHFVRLRDDGLPGIVFSAHLGNWELPAVCAATSTSPAASRCGSWAGRRSRTRSSPSSPGITIAPSTASGSRACRAIASA